jgi:hypothetical protein
VVNCRVELNSNGRQIGKRVSPMPIGQPDPNLTMGGPHGPEMVDASPARTMRASAANQASPHCGVSAEALCAGFHKPLPRKRTTCPGLHDPVVGAEHRCRSAGALPRYLVWDRAGTGQAVRRRWRSLCSSRAARGRDRLAREAPRPGSLAKVLSGFRLGSGELPGRGPVADGELVEPAASRISGRPVKAGDVRLEV